MNLNDFKKKYTDYSASLPMFMRISALSWLEYVQKNSDGRFKPDIDRIMKFSDADINYNFDYDKKHTSINPNVTVGELLRVASQLLSYAPNIFDNEDDPVTNRMREDGVYIVNCLMIYPFSAKKEIA